jgi:Protein of unknown function (DUF2867)
MMQGYAAARGLRRIIVPVPVLAPRVAGLWIGLVTPIPNRLAVPIIEGIIEPVVASTSRASELFPQVVPIGYDEAVRLALDALARLDIETRWSGALNEPAVVDLADREGLVRETRTLDDDAPARDVFASFTSIGGASGWRAWNWAWSLRGLFDRLVGGPGLRRGRRHPTDLFAGEALDFWRVEQIESGKLLRLRAEMKVPGRAWLQWEVMPLGDQRSRLVQTAIFAPRGLVGALYWYLLYPIHGRIFSDLVRAIATVAEAGTDITRAHGRASHLRVADEVVHVAPALRKP